MKTKKKSPSSASLQVYFNFQISFVKEPCTNRALWVKRTEILCRVRCVSAAHVFLHILLRLLDGFSLWVCLVQKKLLSGASSRFPNQTRPDTQESNKHFSCTTKLFENSKVNQFVSIKRLSPDTFLYVCKHTDVKNLNTSSYVYRSILLLLFLFHFFSYVRVCICVSF